MNRLLTALLAVMLAGALAACGAGASPSPGEAGAVSPSPAETRAASPVTRETEEATTEPSPTGTAGDDDDGDDDDDGTGDDDSDEPNELAEVLPEEVGDIPMTYQYEDGDDLLEGEISPEAEEFFERVGADDDDVSSAFGFGADQETGAVISILAFRVPGADEDRLMDEFLRTIEEDAAAGQTATEASLGGKDVVIIEREDEFGMGYVYARDDVVFILGGTSEDLIEEALAQLP